MSKILENMRSRAKARPEPASKSLRVLRQISALAEARREDRAIATSIRALRGNKSDLPERMQTRAAVLKTTKAQQPRAKSDLPERMKSRAEVLKTKLAEDAAIEAAVRALEGGNLAEQMAARAKNTPAVACKGCRARIPVGHNFCPRCLYRLRRAAISVCRKCNKSYRGLVPYEPEFHCGCK